MVACKWLTWARHCEHWEQIIGTIQSPDIHTETDTWKQQMETFGVEFKRLHLTRDQNKSSLINKYEWELTSMKTVPK